MDQLNFIHTQAHFDMISKMREYCPPNGIIIEVGAFVGGSTFYFAEGGRIVYAVDPWHWDSLVYDERDWLIKDAIRLGGGRKIFQTFCRNMGDKLFKTVFPVRGYSDEVAEVFPFQVDMVYVDGCHKKECVELDIKSWWPKIKMGGILCGDDYGGFDVKEVVDRYFPQAEKPFPAQWLVRKQTETL